MLPRVLPVALLLALLTPASGAAAVAKHCRALTGTRTLLRTDTVKVVRIDRRGQTDDDGFRSDSRITYGCVLPDGPVRTLDDGEIDHNEGATISSSTFAVLGHAGHILYADSGTFTELDRATTQEVIDVSTGKAYTVAEQGSVRVQAPKVTHPLVDEAGRFLGLSVSGTKATVVAFTPRGVRHELDSAPAAGLPAGSLTLAAGIAGWTDAGMARTADLSKLSDVPPPPPTPTIQVTDAEVLPPNRGDTTALATFTISSSTSLKSATEAQYAAIVKRYKPTRAAIITGGRVIPGQLVRDGGDFSFGFAVNLPLSVKAGDTVSISYTNQTGTTKVRVVLAAPATRR